MEGLKKDLHQLRIVFLGTPQFAVASLEALIQAGANIVAVVTAPDKPAGRGMKVQESAVKTCALKYQIPVLQPEKLKSADFIEQLKSYQADLQVVIAFRMLPEQVWNMPRLGTVNLHASLLPDYRGAAPINWAIINGEKQTGVSTFLLKHEIDTGDILLQEKIDIPNHCNAGELHDLLMHLGAKVITQTVTIIANGNYKTQPQRGISLKTAPKIFTSNTQINWNLNGQQIIQHILGLAPFPGAYTTINQQLIKIYDATFESAKHQNEIGCIEIVEGKSKQIKISCADGWIFPTQLQLQGKKRMDVADLLRGWAPI